MKDSDMNENLRFIFKTIACVVTDNRISYFPDNLNWNVVYSVCEKHNIANIMAYGLLQGNYGNIPEEIKQKFSENMFYNMAVNERQQNEIKLIFDAFEKQKLDYMPLKGTILKKIYPSTDMRRMGDIDILIKKEQYEEYKTIMLELGYDFIKESHNEYVFKKKGVLVELHRYLITPGNDDMFSYYETGWNIAKKDDEQHFKYRLSHEDEFVYIITHFAKHYRNAGCGIKPLIDIWLYKKKYDLDLEYVNEQLRKMNLYVFAQNIFNLIEVWFGDKEINNTAHEMTMFIVTSGEYGTTINTAAAESIRGNYEKKSKSMIRISSYLKMIFLDKKSMSKKYPLLNKAPILLPAFWIFRVFQTLFFRYNKIVEKAYAVENKFGANVDRYNKHMKDVGLDIYNGRKS